MNDATEIQKLLDEIAADISAATFGNVREPRSRYYEHRGWMYGWTTERDSDGKFNAYACKPVGKGARTEPTRWRPVKSVQFTQRNKAKARARKWYEAAKAKGTP